MESKNAGVMVVESDTDRLLGGVGHNAHRAWVFPLNTPRGLNVLQEYAYDHSFHNGIFVGQGHIERDGRVSNFWSPYADWRNPANPIYNDIGELRYGEPAKVEERENGFRFSYQTTWHDPDGNPLLDESRIYEIFDGGDATLCIATSAKTASYGPILFVANKHSTIGARLQPQLLPELGSRIMKGSARGLEKSTAPEVSADGADYVAYEANPHGLGRFGACLSIVDNSASERRDGPWFIREYGMAMFNANKDESISLDEGTSWTASLRAAAYDGEITDERAREWMSLR